MAFRVDVLAEGERPPAGSRVHVELRDTTLADAPATVLERVDAVVGDAPGDALATVELASPPPANATVWVHVDLTGDGQVAVGDYVTTRSNPVPSGELQPERVPVTVRRVR